MFKIISKQKAAEAEQVRDIYAAMESTLNEAMIELKVTRKKVKNINFRLKPYQLSVSAPHNASEADLIRALSKRLDWAIDQHASLLKRQRQKQQWGGQQKVNQRTPNPFNDALQPVRLWGKTQGIIMGETDRIHYYRHELQNVMPELFAKWQPIVGKAANETRIKKMKTRWGSCNTRAKRVWLSVYLPAFPIECTEYVIVHELCHLHQANHSPAFWHEVKRSMPDYQRWHDMLAGKSGILD